MQPLPLKSRFQVFDIRLVRYWRKGERVSPRRVSGIVASGAMNGQKLFSPLIVGLELFIGGRPGGRYSFFVLERGKIFFSKAGERSAINFRVSSHKIINSRRQRVPGRLVRGLT